MLRARVPLVFVGKLAGFLYWHNQEELWHHLESVRLNQTPPSPLADYFDYIVDVIKMQFTLLCLDDLYWVKGNPQLEPFIKQLRLLLFT